MDWQHVWTATRVSAFAVLWLMAQHVVCWRLGQCGYFSWNWISIDVRSPDLCRGIRYCQSLHYLHNGCSSRDGTITNSGRVQGLGLTTTDIII
ncbi:uncharacterized protein EDB93DRAFT_1120920 [Suillus bovinus]|uniref:uncharacterized protein n=1 Tax=Suillus bovinus TaxID=48563 RepID=UPI001B8772A4|nr:uncharacterized protein EDB93DRAFT_1120920 [Suillus bovinus]KAG2158332.1 hypothetical protein EDB93DRAFT_1120920 [Suillus bovinus]